MSEIAVLDRCNHFRVGRVYVHQAHKLVTARRRKSRGALMKNAPSTISLVSFIHNDTVEPRATSDATQYVPLFRLASR